MLEKKKDYADIPYLPSKKTKLSLFNTFAEAKQNAQAIKDEAAKFEQLIIVVREEGSSENQELLGLAPNILLYTGRAWALIFERRQEDEAYVV